MFDLKIKKENSIKIKIEQCKLVLFVCSLFLTERVPTHHKKNTNNKKKLNF